MERVPVTAVMEICLLGPLAVRQDGVVVPVTARRQAGGAGRAAAGRGLASVTVQNYVMRLNFQSSPSVCLAIFAQGFRLREC